MSRIPASPHVRTAPAPLPVTAKPSSATESHPTKSPQGSKQGIKDQLSLEPQGSTPHIEIDMEGLLSDEVVTPLKPVTQAELSKAMQLEKKVVSGYQPTSEEFSAYQDIVVRINDANPARQQPAEDLDAAQTELNTLKQKANVAEKELVFAMRLEKRVLKGYTPTAEEQTAYENVASRLENAQQSKSVKPASPPVSAEEQKWAHKLMKRAQQGEKLAPKDIERYTSIYNRVQTELETASAQGPAVSSPSSQELDWAHNLETKIKTQGYKATEADRKKYTAIYERLQAQ